MRKIILSVLPLLLFALINSVQAADYTLNVQDNKITVNKDSIKTWYDRDSKNDISPFQDNSLNAGFPHVLSVADNMIIYRIDRIDSKALCDLWEFEKYFNFEAWNTRRVYFILSSEEESPANAQSINAILKRLSEKYDIIVEILGDLPITRDFLKLAWKDGKHVSITYYK